MQKIKSLKCYNCNGVILNLPDDEVEKLNGLTFQCECCGHENQLTGTKFRQVLKHDSSINVLSYDSLNIY